MFITVTVNTLEDLTKRLPVVSACAMTEREQMSSQELDLILGLVLGIGLPLLLLLLTAIACCCCCRKKTVRGE